MILPRQELEQLAATAKAWRERHATIETQLAASGWLLFFNGKVSGWAADLVPQRWRPGVIALSAAGLSAPIFYACEGDEATGSKEFAELDRVACGLPPTRKEGNHGAV